MEDLHCHRLVWSDSHMRAVRLTSLDYDLYVW
jgi:hypothetical protein